MGDITSNCWTRDDNFVPVHESPRSHSHGLSSFFRDCFLFKRIFSPVAQISLLRAAPIRRAVHAPDRVTVFRFAASVRNSLLRPHWHFKRGEKIKLVDGDEERSNDEDGSRHLSIKKVEVSFHDCRLVEKGGISAGNGEFGKVVFDENPVYRQPSSSDGLVLSNRQMFELFLLAFGTLTLTLGLYVKRQDTIREAFQPLSWVELIEVILSLWNSDRTKTLVAHENSNIEITGKVLQCLKPYAWLNDEVINLYLELLKEREKREPQKYLKCHYFNTFFYKKLIGGRGGYNYESVRRWTNQRKLGYCLFECDKIFVPVHQEGHWCLAIINKKDRKFQYLDSLQGTDRRVFPVLARYFVDEVKDKVGKDIDVTSWEPEYVKDLPTQENGFDCGMFMIKYVDFYARDIEICFTQKDMDYFRLRTAREILRQRAE